MSVVRTFVSYDREDLARVRAILRRAAPYGVRPWIDENDLLGTAEGPLRKRILDRAIPECSSLTLFLTEAAIASQWVQDEVGHALSHSVRRPIIPILLDPLPSSKLPRVFETALQQKPGGFDTWCIEGSDPTLPEQLAKEVLGAAKADEWESVVLHLGHREGACTSIPDVWKDLPVIDLRLDYPVGHKEFAATADQLKEITAGLEFLRGRLGKVKRIGICGFAPLGVAVAVGRTWDRGRGVPLEAWNQYTGQVWTSAEPAAVDGWTPETAQHLKVRHEGNLFTDLDTVVVAFTRRKDYEEDVLRWNGARRPSPPVLFTAFPEKITGAAQVTEILSECIAVFAWIRRTYPHFSGVDLVLTLPLPLVAFLAHHLRQLGRINFYDSFVADGRTTYRLTMAW